VERWQRVGPKRWRRRLANLKIQVESLEENKNMERVELIRDCEAVQIPAGTPTTLEKGVEVFITQSLGGTYTLQVPAHGGLFRVMGKDADALGRTPAQAAETALSSGDLETMVWDQLKTCFDPEIPVNIVDLGLVYGMELTPAEDGSQKVDVKMTLTAQGCGMGATIAIDAKHKILSIPGISEANVDLVWDPPWNPQMISPEGRERLGID
jgi:probable FeS assembly SUF system protein SufT